MNLDFVQPHFLSNNFEIFQNNSSVGQIVFTDFFQHNANAEILGKRWKFNLKGFVNVKIEITDPASNTLIVTYSTDMFYRCKNLSFSDTEQYSFKNTNFWGSNYAWLDKNGQEVIQYTYKYGWTLKAKGTITVSDEILKNQKGYLLALLGLYQIKLMRESSSSHHSAVFVH